MKIALLSFQEQRNAWALTLGVSVLLSIGFLPTAQELLGPWVPFSVLPFPILAGIFWISLRETTEPPTPQVSWISASVLPLTLATSGLGWSTPGASLDRVTFLWLAVAAPIGEELLFRGWWFRFFPRVFGPKEVSDRIPLPAVVFFSSIAFSVWHLQNWSALGVSALVQGLYAFPLGLWLGTVRYQTGSLLPPIALHIALNTLSHL